MEASNTSRRKPESSQYASKPTEEISQINLFPQTRQYAPAIKLSRHIHFITHTQIRDIKLT